MSITSIRNLVKSAGWLIALMVICLLGCTPSGPRALLKGDSLLREGQYEAALARLKVAVELLPQNAQAWNCLGLAYHGTHQPAKAVAAYQQALQLNRDLAAARYNLGCLYLEVNNPGEAAVHLTTFTLLQPRMAEGWSKLGTAQLEMRQLAAAKTSYERAITLQPRLAEAWNGLGMLHLHQNRVREALICFTNAAKQQPDYSPAILNQAIVYHQYLKNHPLALQKYEEYLKLKPDPPNAPALRAIMRQLEAELRPAPPLAPTNAIAQLLVKSNLPAKPLTNATPHILAQLPSRTNVPILPPANAGAKVTTGLVAMAAVKIPPAQAMILTSAPPPKVEIAKTLSEPPLEKPAKPPVETNQALMPPHEPAATVARTNQPQVPPVIPSTTPAPELAVTTIQLSSEPPLKSAVDQPPPSTPANEPGKTPVPEGPARNPNKTDEAPTPLLAPTQPAPKSKFLQRVNPVNWFRSKSARSSEATPVTSKPVTEANPLSNARNMRLASSPPTAAATVAPPPPAPVASYPYRQPPRPSAGDRRAAMQALAQGGREQTAGHWNLAVANYQKAVQLDPSFFEARYHLASAFYQSTQVAQALLEYEYALAINPASVDARYNFAVALQKANYPRDAANELERLLAQAPKDARAQLLLANIYAQQLNQPHSARPHYLTVLELEPQHPQAWAIRTWLADNP